MKNLRPSKVFHASCMCQGLMRVSYKYTSSDIILKQIRLKLKFQDLWMVRSIPSAYDQRRGSAIVETDRGILLVSSSGCHFRFPGGKPKKGEASIQAAIRELREETGLQAHDVTYLFKFHESKVFKIKANGEPIPSNEIHYFAFYEPGKEIREKVSYNTLKILKIYYQLKR